MTDERKPRDPRRHNGYEHSDLSPKGVLYFLGGVAVSLLLVYFAVEGLYAALEKRSDAQQSPVNALVTNAPADTRHISKDYPQPRFQIPS